MRLTLALLTILGAAFCSADAEACWLTDRLFGRSPQYVAGYVPYGYVAAYPPPTTAYRPATTAYYAPAPTAYAPATTAYAPATTAYAPATMPYGAGYAPVPATANPAMPAPTTTAARYTANSAPDQATIAAQAATTNQNTANLTAPATATYAAAYAAAYAPTQAAVSVQTMAPVQQLTPIIVARPTWTGATPLSSGAYQVQRPAYYAYYDNPSVYTGLPVAGGQQSVFRPLIDSLRGVQPNQLYLGSGNQYPDSYQTAYVAAYPNTVAPTAPITAAATPVTTPAPMTTTAVPTATMPATQVAPVFVPAAPVRQCGLSRFFGSLFGANYRTTYYRAPVTYYRPVTTVDPVSGMPITVQQPCTSYEQQLHRTPYLSPQPGQFAPANPPAAGSACDTYGSNPYSAAPGGQTWPASPTTGVGQVSGVSPYGQPPVTTPPTNPAPLSGQPAVPGPPASGDRAPVVQPQLQNGAPQQRIESRREATEPDQDNEEQDDSADDTGSLWQLQNAADSTAMIRSHTNRRESKQPDPLTANSPQADPIQAPSDYVAPFAKETRASGATNTRSLAKPTIEAPPLPAPAHRPSEYTRADDRTQIQVREAALTRASTVRSSNIRPQRPSVRAQPRKRDTTWYKVGR